MHLSSQEVASVMLDFPAKVSLPKIASLPRKVSIKPFNSKSIPSEVSDFPTAVVFSKHWGGVTPPTPSAIYVPASKKGRCDWYAKVVKQSVKIF